MDDKRCSTCRYWVRPAPPYDGAWGFCEAIPSARDDLARQRPIRVWADIGFDVETASDFYCAMHEKPNARA